MAEVVVFDTNVLPLARGITSALWLSVRKLCDARAIVITLPELVVRESVNLRREKYLEANAFYLEAIRGIAKFFEMAPVYVPDVEEICADWEEGLRDAFEVLPVHGEDATAALDREAQRVRPARAGRGARDSAIWMSVLRLAEQHERVFFVSRNTTDFADAGGAQLHPALAAESAAATGEVVFHSSLDAFIADVATPIEPPALSVAAIADTLRFDLRDAISADLTDRGTELAADQLDPATIALTELQALRSFSVDGQTLVLIRANGSIAIGLPDDGDLRPFEVVGWIEIQPDSGTVLNGESQEIRLQ